MLYHTEGCHLCDIAMELTDSIQLEYQLSDICDDTKLVEQYGTSIPVLRHVETEKELSWPFTLAQLKEFIGD